MTRSSAFQHPWLSALFCTALALFVGLNGGRPAFGADEPTRTFDIPASSAEKSLKLFSSQSGKEVLFATATTSSIRTPAVRGSYTPHVALEKLLAGTGLIAIQDEASGTLTISRDPNAPGMAPKTNGDHPEHQGTGTVEGRILNSSNGSFLNNARVGVVGSSLETRTDRDGFYRLTQVPAGRVTLTTRFVGMTSASAVIDVSPGVTSSRDFQMALLTDTRREEDVIQLEAFDVAEKQLSAQAMALQEQKDAVNVKNVIAFDEFGDLGEGNIAEYLKYVPGIDTAYNPQNPVNASIRGMPPSGTLITLDGASTATTNVGISRNYDFSVWGTANIERMEINKTPTPDLPANAVGGSINIVSKTGFSAPRPSLKYNVFFTDSALEGLGHYDPTFKKVPGQNDVVTQRKVQPSYSLYYSNPLNEKIAFTLGASYSARLIDQILFNPTWDIVRMVHTSNSVNTVRNYTRRQAYSGSLDWRVSSNDLLTVSLQRNVQDGYSSGSSFAFNLGAGNTGDRDFAQGAATGVGTTNRNYTVNRQERTVDVYSVNYKHNGPEWKLTGMLTYSEGTYKASPNNEFFTGVATTNSLHGNLILRMDGLHAIHEIRNPVYTATTRAGEPVDIFQGNTLSITQTTAVTNIRDNNALNVGFNAEREFNWAIPVRLKSGFLIDRTERVLTGDTITYAFNPPGGADGRAVTNYDVLANNYAGYTLLRDIQGTPQRVVHVSTQKVYELFRQNPTWFTSNEASRYTNWANNNREIEETISAAFLRGDVRFVDNRLLVVAGVRFERTDDKGAGPRNDISAIYQKNPDGTLARTSTGALIPLTTDALGQARLRYTALGTTTDKSYDGFFPSMNSSFEIRKDLIVRAAYARTIGRPELAEIIPGSTVADPNATDATRTITVNNAALKPWYAHNFDLTLEAYGIKGGSSSISLFQKDVTGFFAETSAPATRELIESYGLSWDEVYSTYTVVSKRNAGAASIRGIELAHRQSLLFLPGWGKRIQIFANLTKMEASGADADSFNFSPLRYNWGIGYYGRKFIFNLNGAHGDDLKQTLENVSASIPPGTYTYRLDYPRYDVSCEYNFSKRLGIYANVRNITGSGTRYYAYNSSTPDYATPDQFQYAGALITLGIKGEW